MGLHTAWRRAQDRADCWNYVKTATLLYGHITDDDGDDDEYDGDLLSYSMSRITS